MRSSLYSGLHAPPLTTVLVEADLKDTLEATRESLHEYATTSLVTFDIFDIFDYDGLEEATDIALRRYTERMEAEMHMATTYHWVIIQLPVLNEAGIVMTKDRTPLNREDTVEVLMQLGSHPDLKPRQRVVVTPNEGLPVTLERRDGEVYVD
jgi:hypothetical protein